MIYLGTIKVNTGKAYEVIIEKSFERLSTEIAKAFSDSPNYFIITDENVAPLYCEQVEKAVSEAGGKMVTFTIRAGEASKSINMLTEIYSFLLKNDADRTSVIIALGGGVVGDLASFGAATFMRGLRYAHIPTTLLSQVDSSVGGKTAIDFNGYKNIIGSFYQPDLVYINTAALKTLPRREFSAGMAEVIKYGLIADSGFYGDIYDNLENIYDDEVVINLVSKCVEMKARIVERDERDTGLREILNFGHTAGHALEKLSGFKLMHGEAVALGMLAAILISKNRGAHIDERRYKEIIMALGLPAHINAIQAEDVYEAMQKDKKVKYGKISYVLLEETGKAYTGHDITKDEIISAVNNISAGIA